MVCTQILSFLGVSNIISQIISQKFDQEAILESTYDFSSISNSVFGIKSIGSGTDYPFSKNTSINYIAKITKKDENTNRSFSNFYLSNSKNPRKLHNPNQLLSKSYFSEILLNISKREDVSINHITLERIKNDVDSIYFQEVWIEFVGKTPIPLDAGLRREILAKLTPMILENIEKHRLRIDIMSQWN